MRMLITSTRSSASGRPVWSSTAARGKAARDWPSFHAIVRELESLGNDETLLVQSGRPVGVFRTHEEAPRDLIANAKLVGHWSNWEQFRALEKLGLIMYGEMTTGSWIYFGTQSILQGTYERSRRRRAGTSADRWRAISS